MKMFRDLTVRAPKALHEKFASGLESRLADGWSRDKEGEARSLTDIGKTISFFYFVCDERGDRRSARLALVEGRDAGDLYVSNVVPRKTGQLTYDEYNLVLMEFHDKYAGPLAREMGFAVSLSSDHQTIEDWVSAESAKILRSFSSMANRSTGSAHPSDQRIWYAFVASVVEKNDPLDPTRLKRWLVEDERWTEDAAQKLVIEFEQETGLLRYCKGY